jgi:hypothetical protein
VREARRGARADDATALASDALRGAYAAAAAPITPAAARRPLGGDCGICFEPMRDDTDAEATTWCAACGNAVHAACFARWRERAAAATCVYCRAAWRAGDAPPADDAVGASGYISLLGASAEHQAGSSLHELYPDTARWIVGRAGGCG